MHYWTDQLVLYTLSYAIWIRAITNSVSKKTSRINKHPIIRPNTLKSCTAPFKLANPDAPHWGAREHFSSLSHPRAIRGRDLFLHLGMEGEEIV